MYNSTVTISIGCIIAQLLSIGCVISQLLSIGSIIAQLFSIGCMIMIAQLLSIVAQLIEPLIVDHPRHNNYRDTV